MEVNEAHMGSLCWCKHIMRFAFFHSLTDNIKMNIKVVVFTIECLITWNQCAVVVFNIIYEGTFLTESESETETGLYMKTIMKNKHIY